MHFYALPNYLVPAAIMLAARATQPLGLALMHAGRRERRKKYEEERRRKKNKKEEEEPQLSPNETPHEQTTVFSNIVSNKKP